MSVKNHHNMQASSAQPWLEHRPFPLEELKEVSRRLVLDCAAFYARKAAVRLAAWLRLHAEQIVDKDPPNPWRRFAAGVLRFLSDVCDGIAGGLRNGFSRTGAVAR